MSRNASMQYNEQSLFTATPGDLLIRLFNAEIKNIKVAIIHINEKNMVAANEKLIKAQDIMGELIYSLDNTYEISKELTLIYRFIKNELITANVSKDIKKLEQILPLVTELRDTWVTANQISRNRC